MMMMRTTMTNNNVPKNKRRNGIATTDSVCLGVCVCVVCGVWSSSSSTHRQCRHRLRHRHRLPHCVVAPCTAPAVKSINAMSRHRGRESGGWSLQICLELGKNAAQVVGVVFIFGAQATFRWKNMSEKIQTHFVFIFAFCCYFLFYFLSVFAIVRQENVTYGLVYVPRMACPAACRLAK